MKVYITIYLKLLQLQVWEAKIKYFSSLTLGFVWFLNSTVISNRTVKIFPVIKRKAHKKAHQMKPSGIWLVDPCLTLQFIYLILNKNPQYSDYQLQLSAL